MKKSSRDRRVARRLIEKSFGYKLSTSELYQAAKDSKKLAKDAEILSIMFQLTA